MRIIFIYSGLAACEKVLDISHGDLYKWYAILVGTKSQFLPTKGKIENGYLFKDYVDKAIKIKPQDNYLYHLMGRFKYEVSELSWIERKVRFYICLGSTRLILLVIFSKMGNNLYLRI